MPLILAFFLLALVVVGEPRDERTHDFATAFSPETCLWVEGPQLARFLEQGPDHPLLQAFEQSPLGARLLRDEEGNPFTLKQLVRYSKSELGFDPLRALASATSGGAALGVEVLDDGTSWTIVARARDAQHAQKALNRLREYAAGEFEATRADDFLVLSDRHASLEQTLRRVRANDAESGASSLASHPRFIEAIKNAGSGALLRAFVDLNRVEELTGGNGLAELRALERNAGAHFLLGSENALSLSSATSLLAEIHVRELSLELSIETFGGASQHESLAMAQARHPSPSSGDVMRGVIHRDIENLFAHRGELFGSETLAGFNEFADNAALFLGGADLERDVLPGISKSIGIVAREVSYAEGPKPQIPLPGLALIFELNDPERLGPHLSSAFQSSVALVSIDRAQEGQPPLLLDLELVGDVPMTSAHFLPPLNGEVVDVRFNLEPACARMDELFVLGTHADVVRSVIRDLRQGRSEEQSMAAGSSALSLAGPAAAALLEANLETLAMNQVLDDGVTMEEALSELELALEFVRGLESFELNLTPRPSSTDREGVSFRAKLRLHVNGGNRARTR